MIEVAQKREFELELQKKRKQIHIHNTIFSAKMRLLICVLDDRRVLGITSVGNHTKELIVLLDATSMEKRDISVIIVSRGCVSASTAARWAISRPSVLFWQQ